MPLLKFLRRSGEASVAPKAASSAEAVQQARRTARHRLIGAVVLLGIGVIGFPLVFQTQPRPIPVDIAIDIPKKDSAPPLTVGLNAPPVVPSGISASGNEVRAPATPLRETVELPTPNTPLDPSAVLPSAAQPNPAAAKASAPAARASAPAARASAPAARASAPAARASAPLPKDVTVSTKSEPAERGRFVVQAGAYADSDVVRDVRSRLERQGMKTFIQTIEVDGAPRTRVRIGPYATRQEAQEAMARVKALGLAASLISL